jgi:outer membrane protein assembly factor BamB
MRAKSGKEIWKYDVLRDLAPVMKRYIPADAKVSYNCYIKIKLFGDRLIVKAFTGWEVEKITDKVEALLCLDKNGKQLWKVESHGYPGICAYSDIHLIDNKLVMGTWTSGDNISGPTYLHAFDFHTGKRLWQFTVKHEDELAYTEATDVAATVVGNRIVGVTNYGRVFVLDKDGKKINDFIAFEPIKHRETVVCTNVWGAAAIGSGNELVIAPGKSVVKGADYVAKAPVEHPDAGSIKVFDLKGNLRWKFRLGAEATKVAVKNNYIVLSAAHNQNNLNYSYCGIYAFNLTRKEEGKKQDLTQESVLDKFIGHYRTAGGIHWGCIDTSQDNRVICACTWPTRVGAEKHGRHSLYILRLE